MANLASNPMWADLATSPSKVQTDLMGPAYSYADNLPGPASLGVGTDGSFSQLSSNAGAIGTYVKALISGDPPLGNQYFVNTGVVCTAPDGSTQPRMNYINNKASGADMMPASMSEIGSDFNGLIPGIVGDIEGLDPTYMFSALTQDGTPACQCYSCNVTSGSGTAFLTTALSPDFDATQCTLVDPAQCKAPTTETFTNASGSAAAAPTILALAALIWLVFSGK
jgi:hypothetical protein